MPGVETDPHWEHFSQDGFLGLVHGPCDESYVVCVEQARRRWSGRVPQEDKALLGAFRMLVAVPLPAVGDERGETHESRTVCPGFDQAT